MNAIDPSKQPSAAADQRPYEPSMEEILASIRRIIADDQSAPARAGCEEELNLRASLESASLAAPQDVPSVVPQTRSVEAAPRQATSAQAADDAADKAADKAADLAKHSSDLAKDASAGSSPAQSRAPMAFDSAEPVASIVAHGVRPEAPKAGSPPPRVVPVTATLGHIAAPQFAMPDRPARPADLPASARDAEPRLRSAEASVRPAEIVVRPAETAPSERADRRAEPSAGTQERTHAIERTQTIERGQTNPVFDRSPDGTAEAGSHLFSTRTDKSVAAAFTTLAASRVLGDDETLKAVVGDVIRPMLKTWLDENLPGLVERLVRAEIERVSRGR